MIGLSATVAGLVLMCVVVACTVDAGLETERDQSPPMATLVPTVTPEPTGIPPDDDAPMATSIPTVTPEPTEVRCDGGLVSVAPLVSKTIDRANEISFAAAEQATSAEDAVRRARNALNEISAMWGALGQGRGERVQRLVDGVGAAWKWGTNVEAANPKGFERHMTGIADAYGELAEALDECDELSSSVDRLRREVRDINLLIAELK